MIRWNLLVLALLAGLSISLSAQSTSDEDAFFGDQATNPAPPAGSSESDFFANGNAEANNTVKSDYQENFTKQEPIRFGGSFSFVNKIGINYYRDMADWTGNYLFGIPPADETNLGKSELSSIDLKAMLYFTARTSSSLRFFGKTKVAYPFVAAATSLTTGGIVVLPNFQLWELFTDIAVTDRMFIRAGKQMVKWGANPFAFWSPADVISLTAIDISDRGAELEGPVAIKTNIGFGDNNLDMYVIAPGDGSQLRSVSDLSYAARATFLVGSWQLGVGALYQKQQDWNFVATASGSIWKFNVFGEAKVNRTAYGFYILSDGTAVDKRSDWFFSGTAGISFSNSDIYLDTVMVQYYFNGMGFAQAPSRQLLKSEAQLLMLTSWPGMHYLAVTAQESFVKDSKVHVLLTWLGNLSDGSGIIWPAVNFDLTNDIVLGLEAKYYYGGDNSQFHGLTAEGVPYYRQRYYFGLSLNLGIGNF